jgi:30S ribosomal protein S31
MGRGDIKTKRGKIFAGSFGKTRAAKVATKVAATAVEKAPKAEKAPKKAK